MSGVTKFIIALIIFISVIGISWAVMIMPSKAAYDKCLTNKTELQNQLKEMEIASKQLDQWEQTVKEFQDLLTQLQKNTTSSKEGFISSLLKDFEQLIAELSLTDNSVTVSNLNLGNLTTTTVGDEEEGGSFATLSVPVRITMTAKYSTIIKFIDALGQLKLRKMVRINALRLSASRPKPGESPTLRVNITLNAFMFKTQ